MLDSISRTLARIKADLLARRNIEDYVVAALAIVLAFLGVVDAGISMEVKLSVVLAALALLVFNLTVPDYRAADLDQVLQDRSAYPRFGDRIKGKRTLWIYAASAVNVLSGENLQAIREEILNYKDGELRVIIQDPQQKAAMEILKQQLDDSVDYPVQHMDTSIAETLKRLKTIKSWKCPGTFKYALLPYNPGFSLLVIDPHRNSGVAIPEFYAFHNQHTGSRMHIEITRSSSSRWFDYWVSQFEYMWAEAYQPGVEDEPPQP